ncbi:hypothetical protein [Nocardiopsis deserti]|uniref:hypothetical protein n=1 Tax=Nocardiopsis deserti TaxID=2605988 RepID=UPI00123C6880|nr:hypothetical protein [Nocardiopsis deserti]
MYAIYDDQTEDRLSTGHVTVEQAQEHMRTLLTRTREQVEATGDSVAGMVLEWSIRSEETGHPVAWHYGPPPITAVYE